MLNYEEEPDLIPFKTTDLDDVKVHLIIIE
jgi:hypothetical protein